MAEALRASVDLLVSETENPRGLESGDHKLINKKTRTGGPFTGRRLDTGERSPMIYYASVKKYSKGMAEASWLRALGQWCDAAGGGMRRTTDPELL